MVSLFNTGRSIAQIVQVQRIMRSLFVFVGDRNDQIVINCHRSVTVIFIGDWHGREKPIGFFSRCNCTLLAYNKANNCLLILLDCLIINCYDLI